MEDQEGIEPVLETLKRRSPTPVGFWSMMKNGGSGRNRTDVLQLKRKPLYTNVSYRPKLDFLNVAYLVHSVKHQMKIYSAVVKSPRRTQLDIPISVLERAVPKLIYPMYLPVFGAPDNKGLIFPDATS